MQRGADTGCSPDIREANRPRAIGLTETNSTINRPLTIEGANSIVWIKVANSSISAPESVDSC